MKYSLFTFILISLLFGSCVKEEGLGGNAIIEGKVYVLDYNAELTSKLGEYYGGNIDVFIIYGEDEIYSDDFKTNYDGSYQFKHLRPGDYTVYAYSEDTTGVTVNKDNPVFKTVTITDKDQVVDLEDIIIVK